MSAWWSYLELLMGSDCPADAARKVGICRSNFTRWKAGERPKPAYVVKVARAYNANVLDALVAAGVITNEEASAAEVDPGQAAVDEASRLKSEARRLLELSDDLESALRAVRTQV